MNSDEAENEARRMLAEVYRPEGIEIWLHSPNRALGGRTAIDMIWDGDAEHVLTAIEALITGATR